MRQNVWLLVAVVFVACALWLGLLRWHRTSAPVFNQAQQSAPDDIYGRGRPQIIQHYSQSDIDKLMLTPRGQEVLCSSIGTKGDGLDEPSFLLAEQALMGRDTVEDGCLEQTLYRLNNELLSEEIKGMSHSNSESNDFAVSMLRKFPVATSRVIRQQYHLGTANSNISAIPLLLNLRLESSCPDILASVAALRQAHNLFEDEFLKAYTKICQ